MTSESALSGAELDLSCNPEVAKITGITLAEGLTAKGDQTIAADGRTAKISFYGNEQSAKEGLTVATVTMQPVAEGTSSLSITNGTAAMSGTTLDYTVTASGDAYAFSAEGVAEGDQVVVALKGDSNLDGKHTAADAVMAKAAALGKLTPAPVQEAVAHVNGDSKITAADAVMIKAITLGKTEAKW